MRVVELMRTDVKTITPGAPVGDAVIVLAQARVSALPVVDLHNHLIGVLSTSDVLGALAEARDAAARSELLEETLVQELMTPSPLTIAADADVTEAAREMLYAEVRRLFVEDRGRLVGVISLTDIVGAVATAKL